MTDRNEVQLEGTIRGEPRYFDGGKTPCLKVNVITGEDKPHTGGTDFKKKSRTNNVPVSIFGDEALANKHSKEGDRISLSGYITTSSWVSKKTGNREYQTNVVAKKVSVTAREPGGPPLDDGNIPF